MQKWDDIKSGFEIDGSLRDIYLENIDTAIWGSFIAEVKLSQYKFEFTHGDVVKEFPSDLITIKNMQQTNPTTLRLWITEKIQLNCHFFVETEIELDISPHDIQTESAYTQLLCFLKWLAIVTKGEVKLTHEGMQGQVILSVTK